MGSSSKIMFCYPQYVLTDDFLDLDINAEGFTWDWATRHGSRGLVIWRSSDLLTWSEPELMM